MAGRGGLREAVSESGKAKMTARAVAGIAVCIVAIVGSITRWRLRKNFQSGGNIRRMKSHMFGELAINSAGLTFVPGIAQPMMTSVTSVISVPRQPTRGVPLAKG